MRRLYLIIYSVFWLLFWLPFQGGAFASSVREGCPKVALVLGGGGAKGAAEVGVLKYLKELDVPIDMVVGTSIGSIVGGLYCSGVDVATMDHLFRSQEWLDLFTDRAKELRTELYTERDGVEYVLGFPIGRKNKPSQSDSPLFGLLKGDSITNLLGRISGYTESMSFDDLPVPFRCVAVDIKTMQEVVFNQGRLPLAMRASMAIPAVFKPLRMGDRLMVDGGVLNNLPVDVARRMGADIVIAVDLNQDEELKQESEENWFSQVLGSLDLGGHLNWLVRRPDNEKYRRNLEKADLVITPDIHEFDVASFNADAVATMIDRGEAAAKKERLKLVLLAMKARGKS